MTIPLVAEKANAGLKVHHELMAFETEECLQFIDVTDWFQEIVGRSGVRNGVANLQTRHTTTAIMINEHEPLLIQDMKDILRALAPCDAAYRHDDFEIRTVNMCPEEEKNGHAHCKAMLLKSSEAVISWRARCNWALGSGFSS